MRFTRRTLVNFSVLNSYLRSIDETVAQTGNHFGEVRSGLFDLMSARRQIYVPYSEVVKALNFIT